jgi:hypothetical protein
MTGVAAFVRKGRRDRGREAASAWLHLGGSGSGADRRVLSSLARHQQALGPCEVAHGRHMLRSTYGDEARVGAESVRPVGFNSCLPVGRAG